MTKPAGPIRTMPQVPWPPEKSAKLDCQDSTTGIYCICMDDFGYLYIDMYTHCFPVIFESF